MRSKCKKCDCERESELTDLEKFNIFCVKCYSFTNHEQIESLEILENKIYKINEQLSLF